MAGEIWVLVEQWRGRISDITYEVLALGREVAEALAGSLQAVVLGPGAGESASSLGAGGGGRVGGDLGVAGPGRPICGLLHPLGGQGRRPRPPPVCPRRFRDSPRGAAAGTRTGGAGAR